MTDSSQDPFVEHRPLLHSIAYRMLGSVADAEDVVQEAFLRWQAVDRERIASCRAYLAKMVTRLSIDHLRSAYVRRERSGRTELPEPLPPGWLVESESSALLAESLTMAFLVLLERLTPSERAAFVLRVALDYDYRDVAAILDRSQAACRQLVRRARRNLSLDEPRFTPSHEQVERSVASFARCCEIGDVEGLLAVLAPEVVLLADGGTDRASFGRVRALTEPVRGAEKVARFLIAAAAQAPSGARSELGTVSGSPAVLSFVGGRLVGVLSFDVAAGRITRVFVQADPSKLSRIGAAMIADEPETG